MNQQFKKIFSVALAVIVGLGIIFFALGGIGLRDNKVSFEPTIIGDTWKDSLLTIPSPKTLDVAQNNPLVHATTTADIIARELVTNYTLVQQNRATTTLSDADAQSIAEMLVDKIEIPKGVIYSAKNIRISNDSSSVAIANYIKSIYDVMQGFSSARKTDEITIIAEALASKDEAKLDSLSPIITEYRALQKNLLSISTPPTIAHLHLRLAQSYANIESSVTSMQKVLTDPMLGLAAYAQYKKENDVLRALDTEYQGYGSPQ
ncbi:MAG: hypothetical protein WBC83_02740 [Minisyncoccia bacterium]